MSGAVVEGGAPFQTLPVWWPPDVTKPTHKLAQPKPDALEGKTMKIRMKIDVGTFHGMTNVKRGDVVDIDDDNAKRYIGLGYAEPYSKSDVPVEKATLSQDDVESASLDVPPDDDDDEPKPLDEPVKKAPAKRAPARAARHERT